MAEKDVYGLYRADNKQIDLTVAEYDGIASPGELVVDANPGPGAYRVYVANASGNLIPVQGGGGGTTLPGGGVGTIQFNNGGVFGGITGLTYDPINNQLNSTMTINLGGNGSVRITGGLPGQVLVSNGAGGLSWVTPTSSNISNGTSSVSIPTVNGNVLTVVGGVTVLNVNSGGANLAGNANITGEANVGGNVNVVGNVTAGNVFTNTITSTTSLTLNAGGSNQSINLNPSGPNGTVNVGNTRISNLAMPLNTNDAATKGYVDAVAQGLQPKATVQAATTGPIGGTYSPGTAGIGATLTFGTPLGAIDGISLNIGDRVLLKNQADPTTNGIYVKTSTTVLTRATDANTAALLPEGSFVYVEAGTVNNKSGFVVTDPVTTLGVSDVNFAQFSGAGQYTAGTGLGLTGTQFFLANTAVTAGTYGNATTVPQFTVDAQGRLTAVSNVTVVANAETLLGTFINANVTGSNLTSVGNLVGLTVVGDSNLGPVANVTITGGSNGQVLTTDGAGNLSWADAPVGNMLQNGNSNVIVAPNGNVNFSVTGTPNVMSVSTGGLTVSGNSNVTGTSNVGGTLNVAGAANVAGNVVGGNLNTTGLANVGNLTVSGNSNLGNVGNVTITGGANGQVLRTDGNGNLTWSNVALAAGNVYEIQFNNGANGLAANTGFTINPTTQVANIANLDVVGTSNLGANGNVHITGGNAGQFLQTDGNGNLSWANAGVPAAPNLSLQFNNNGVFGGTTFTWSPTNDGIISDAGTGNTTFFGNSDTGLQMTGNSAGLDNYTLLTHTDLQLVDNISGNLTYMDANGLATPTANTISLNVFGVSELNDVSNVRIYGGNLGEVLTTDGTGNLSWTSIKPKAWVNVATTESLESAFGTTFAYDNGANGVGATLVGGLAGGTFAIDGVDLNPGDRVLINNQATDEYNGIYEFTSNAPLTFTRTTDFDEVHETAPGTTVYVRNGATYANSVWYQDPTITAIGASTVRFNRAGGSGDAYTPKAWALVATTDRLANIIGGSWTYADGANTSDPGVGATLTANIGGPIPTIDGVAVGGGGRVLIASEANSAWNGVYTLTSASPYIFTRATDWDQANEIPTGTTLYVWKGNTYGNTTWAQFSNVSTFGVDADAIYRTGGANYLGYGPNSAIQVLNGNILIGNTTANANAVANIKIQGGSNGQVLTTDGAGNLRWSVTGSRPWLHVATTDRLANLISGTWTYANGSNSSNPGVGATLTSSAGSGNIFIDGVQIFGGYRVLVNNEANQAWNGIYTYTSSAPYTFTRATDWDEPSEFARGTMVDIREGTLYGNTIWYQHPDLGTVGLDGMEFYRAGGANYLGYGTNSAIRMANGNIFIGNTTANANAIANIKIQGGSNGAIIQTDGTGNLSWLPAGNPSTVLTDMWYANTAQAIPVAIDGTIVTFGVDSSLFGNIPGLTYSAGVFTYTGPDIDVRINYQLAYAINGTGSRKGAIRLNSGPNQVSQVGMTWVAATPGWPSVLNGGATVRLTSGMTFSIITYQNGGSPSLNLEIPANVTTASYVQISTLQQAVYLLGGQNPAYGVAYPTAGITTISGTNIATATTIMTFTIPSAGIWEVDAVLRVYKVSLTDAFFVLYDSAGTIVPNSEFAVFSQSPAGWQSTGSRPIILTTTGSATYTLRAWSATSAQVYNDANGRSFVQWKQLAQLTNTVQGLRSKFSAQRNADLTVNNSTVTNVNFPDSVVNTIGGLDYNTTTGVWTNNSGGTLQLNVTATYLYDNVGTGAREFYIRNITRAVRYGYNTTGTQGATVNAVVELSPGDTMEAIAFQNSGAARFLYGTSSQYGMRVYITELGRG